MKISISSVKPGLILARKPGQKVHIDPDYILKYKGLDNEKAVISIRTINDRWYSNIRKMDIGDQWYLTQDITITYIGQDKWQNGRIHIAAPKSINIRRTELRLG